MSNVSVDFVLYRSTVHPVSGKPGPWWVFNLRFIGGEDFSVYGGTSFSYVEREFQELEWAISQDDMAICQVLGALFPREAGLHIRAGSLFDEYTNQYFSTLMSSLEKLPFHGQK